MSEATHAPTGDIRRFFELSLDLLCIANVAGFFVQVSPAFTEVLGWSADELRAQPFLNLVHPEDIDATLAEIGRLSQGADTVRFENRYRCRSGEWRWLSWTSRPDVTTGLLYAVARDVTVQRRLIDELIEARAAADSANVAKTAFINHITHELRTPLNAIIGYSEMVSEDLEQPGFDVADAQVSLARVGDAGRQLLVLINQVLDLAKVEAGQSGLEQASLDIASLVDSAAATVRPLVARSGSRLFVEVDAAVGVRIADETKLRQIIINLLANAARFTTGGSIWVRTHLSDAGRVHFEVADTGIGIAPEHHAAIFQPFVQAPSTVAQAAGGSGLGLSISRHLARAMGGDLLVASDAGHGSRFWMDLPLLPAPGAGR